MLVKEIKEYEHVKLAVYQQSKADKDFCGDAFFHHETDKYFICALADGLGSGESAYQSASFIMDLIRDNHKSEVDYLMNLCNEKLKFHRGAVLTIFKIYFTTSELTYCNIGNITFYLLMPNGKAIQPIPIRGFLAGRKQKIVKEHFKTERNSLFTLFTDGVRSAFIHDIIKKSPVMDPEKVLDHVKGEYIKPEDDATIIVGKFFK